MGTGQSTPRDETPDEPNQGGFVQHLFSYPPLSMPIDQTSNRPDQYYSQDPFNYPTLCMPTDQTPNEPNQGYFQYPFHYPPHSTPTGQAPNETNQGYFQDPFYYPPFSTPTGQAPNQLVQGYLQDPFNYPSMNMLTDQTPSGPVQGYLQDGSNPPLGRLPDQNRKCFSCMIPEPTGEEYTKVDDGRYLCSNCLSISIMEPRQLKPVIRQVYTFFEEFLKVPVKRDIPIFLVKANGFIDCEPDLIGPGRPDWPFTLERDVEDAICQAVIFKWLRYTGDIIHNNNDPSYKTQKDAEFALRLTLILAEKMKNNDGVPCSPASFRKARRAIEKYGLEDTLGRVALARSIPE
ncbi:hypothetical protein Vadar_003944 [Vaccinium darrowii]|uniref:Uncharacterized protein n=1 Tax=Vaccinium darrowii TaxID=229202 RepID=A0ACB7Y4R4_9ERIC|nr:hypothetical protein Vadar_003944 [Vaccinium darrowii]